MRSRTLAALLLFTGCSQVHQTDAGPAPDGGTRDTGWRAPDANVLATLDASRGDTGGLNPPPGDAGVVMPPPGAVVCGAHVCADGQQCCLLTLQCFDPADAAACGVPAGTTDPGACASNADCATGELCEHNDIFSSTAIPTAACGGTVGHCVMMRPPSDCGGFGSAVCGCDGRTYPDACAASRAGVRVSWMFPCGSDAADAITYLCSASSPACPPGAHCDLAMGRCRGDVPLVACGLDAQCPDGYACCGVVGACMPSSCPECCFTPPVGTWFPCLDAQDCSRLGSDGMAFGTQDYYCDGEGCGTPGGCARAEGACSGVLAPVCGCDGLSYTNDCWADLAHVRVAHTGMCP